MIDISSISVVPVVVGVMVVVAGGVVGRLLRHRVAGLDATDQLRAASYLARCSAALEYAGLPTREVRHRIGLLHADLAESATRSGLDVTLARLPPPRALAASIEPDRTGPTWLRGMLWVLALLTAGVLAAGTFVAGFEMAAQPGQTATWSGPLWTSLEVTAGETGQASTVELALPAGIPVSLIVFLVGARAWRLATRRTSASP